VLDRLSSPRHVENSRMRSFNHTNTPLNQTTISLSIKDRSDLHTDLLEAEHQPRLDNGQAAKVSNGLRNINSVYHKLSQKIMAVGKIYHLYSSNRSPVDACARI